MTRTRIRRLAVGILVLMLAPAFARASEDPARDTGTSHALCWRGHPAPVCRSFLLTEFGLLGRTDNTQVYPGEVLTFDLGWMKNVSSDEALGFSGYALASESGSRYGVRGRYRRWFSRNLSWDSSAGLLLAGREETIGFAAPGLVLGTGLNKWDLIGVTFEAEYMRRTDDAPFQDPHQPHRRHISVRVGLKAGSYLGVTSAAVVGLVAAVGHAFGEEN